MPVPGPGEFVVSGLYLSIDPAMRRWISADYREPVAIGEVMEAGAVAQVTASKHSGFAVGDHVYGAFGVQEFARSDGKGVTKLDPLLAPLTSCLGALGTTGLTGYFGLLDVGRVKSGETVVVSGAAGAVGSVAGQIARIKGCRTIRIAGGPQKCAWLTGELGFDAAIDHRAENVADALKQHAPEGIDVFLDNVGGEILRNYLTLIAARASMIGMLTPDYVDRYPAARAELARWIREGRLISREQILDGGVGAFPDALRKLFAGENTGKLVLALQ